MRIKSVQFNNHKILGSLKVDFCDADGQAVDTVIIAGENGVGKSSLLEEIYKVATFQIDKNMLPIHVVYEINTDEINLSYSLGENNRVFAEAPGVLTRKVPADLPDTQKAIGFRVIFSDVDINFKSKKITTVTSMDIDEEQAKSTRSDNELPNIIQQLLIDVQNLDDATLAQFVRTNYETSSSGIFKIDINTIQGRMARFKKAFEFMFDNLKYVEVGNVNGHKDIIFMRDGKKISLNDLSSGEKQIVYRASFLLKNKNSMEDAFVLIDEPEISMHPEWQKKIMEFYKRLFYDNSGKQTSQIFAVTHSPFIIHNENRRNDKVIVLARDENGDIIVKDRPEYFKCTSIEAIQDAFSIQSFSADKPTVYLEGRTDEKYFNKALEIFEYDTTFQFKWIGYVGDKGQEENTGKDALSKAVHFLTGRDLPIKNICLFDCDTTRTETVKNNVYVRTIPAFENTKNMKKGIENALVLDSVDLEQFYQSKTKEGDYGNNNIITDFKKMEFCDYICNMDKEELKSIFANLKDVIDSMAAIFEGIE